LRLQGSEWVVLQVRGLVLPSVTEFDRKLNSGVLERDRMMQIDMDDEQVDGAGWVLRTKERMKDSQLQLAIRIPEKAGRYDARRLPRKCSMRRFLSCS
jgi:hypothetical protein